MKKEKNTHENAIKKVFGILLLVFGILTTFIYVYELIVSSAYIVMLSAEFWRLFASAVSSAAAFLAGLYSYRARFRAFSTAGLVLLFFSSAASVISVPIFSGNTVYFLPMLVFSAVLLISHAVNRKSRS